MSRLIIVAARNVSELKRLKICQEQADLFYRKNGCFTWQRTS